MKLVNLAKLTFGLFLFEKSSASEVILNQGKKFKVNSTESESDFHSNSTGFCGPKYGYRSCGNEECCSKDGRCGFNLDYCDYGCQEEFGRCLKNNTNIYDPVHYRGSDDYDIYIEVDNNSHIYNNDKYDKYGKYYLNAIEELTSKTMNSIYDIIYHYNYTYIDNGRMDSQITREVSQNYSKKLKLIRKGIDPSDVRFLFIQEKNETILPNPDSEKFYIPIKTSLLNYTIYEDPRGSIIKAYLSDGILNRVCNLPGVVYCIGSMEYYNKINKTKIMNESDDNKLENKLKKQNKQNKTKKSKESK